MFWELVFLWDAKKREGMIIVPHDKLGVDRIGSGNKELHLDTTNLTHFYTLHWILRVATVIVIIKISLCYLHSSQRR